MAATPSDKDQVQVSLKLLVNKDKNRVLFAEAGKDFVDVLFSFLTLPLGTIARLVSKDSSIPPLSVSCLSSLYESVAKLDQQSFCIDNFKELLLKPRNSSEGYCRSLKLNIDDTEQTKFFMCENISCYIDLLSAFRINCNCGKFLKREVPLDCVDGDEGFVNDVVTFIITDDLIVMPNSMDTRLTSFGLLQNCGEDILSLQLVTVNVTRRKVLDLLKCSLISKSALTDFFLEKKPVLVSSGLCPCDVATQSSIKVNVKLMMRKSDSKILYALGEEDFANFLFSFLTLPLGAVVRLLECHSSVGSIDGLYKSIVDLTETKHWIFPEAKDMLVDPRVAPQFKSIKQILPISEPCSFASNYYCFYNRNQGFRSSMGRNKCYVSSSSMSYNADDAYRIFNFRNLDSGIEGFVKGPAMFIATDDLAVAPMSPIYGLSFLKRVNVPVDDLMEKAITIGVKEVSQCIYLCNVWFVYKVSFSYN